MNCYANLMISDLLKIPRSPNPNGAVQFQYGTQLIVDKVEILGTIISARNYEQKSIYEIDDGTGIIQCWQFHQSSVDDQIAEWMTASEQLQSENLASNDSSVDELSEYCAKIQLTSKSYNRGDLVWLRGKLKDFNGIRSVWIDFSKIVEDANWEIYFIARQVELYRKIYDNS